MEQKDFGKILSQTIARLRRERGMTQGALAERLGVTFQAVSKWENEQSCPDVSLLPYLAETLEVRIDGLFDLPEQDTRPGGAGALPWKDDGMLRAVLFQGTRLLEQGAPGSERMTFCYQGEACAVQSYFSIECGDVDGDVSTNQGNIRCGDVKGDVGSNTGNITCDCVEGDVRSESGDITCDSVDGDVSSEKGNITCDAIEGDARAAQGHIHCDEIHGDVHNV